MHSHTESFYAVKLPTALRRNAERLAVSGPGAGPSLFYFRDQAVRFKNSLAQAGIARARVTKVKVFYRWPVLFCFLLAAFCFPSTAAQGDGALALIKPARTGQPPAATQPAPASIAVAPPLPDFPPFPAAVVVPVTTQSWFFAATATDVHNLESDFSNEVVCLTTNRRPVITLAWDRSPGTNTVTNYSVYYGRAAHTYTNCTPAGTNLTLTVSTRPPLLTNIVATFTLQTATTAAGPWSDWQSLTFTNPAGSMFYRARATISGSIWTLRPESTGSLKPAAWLTTPGWTNRTQTAQPFMRYQRSARWQ